MPYTLFWKKNLFCLKYVKYVSYVFPIFLTVAEYSYIKMIFNHFIIDLYLCLSQLFLFTNSASVNISVHKSIPKYTEIEIWFKC